MTNETSLAAVMEQHPQLTMDGLVVVSRSHETSEQRGARVADGRAKLAERTKRVDEIVAWIRENLRPIATPSQGSYSLKHLVEQHIGYITNGEFIAAGFIAGYPYREDGGVNVTFGVSALDVRRLTS